MSHYNFGVRGRSPTKTLALDVSLYWGVNASTTSGGTVPFKIWEGKKRAKIRAIYDNFRVCVQISLKPMKIATICKRH